MTEKLPLFVFGTLRRGECNHHYLHNRYARVVVAQLRGYRRVETLMIDRAPDGEVTGELFFLDPARYFATLAGCDDLEEIPLGQMQGDLYERRRVSVSTSDGLVTAWAYVRPDSAAASPEL